MFRIPALLPLPDGIVLAFAEARPALHDSGAIDLVIRRSTNNGERWASPRVVASSELLGRPRLATVGNPCPVYDRTTNTVWMLITSNHADDAEWMIHARTGKVK